MTFTYTQMFLKNPNILSFQRFIVNINDIAIIWHINKTLKNNVFLSL